MKRIAVRLLVVPAGFALAVLAFAHAASENDALPFGPGFFGRSGIDAHAMGRLADRGFRAEITARQIEAAAGVGEELSREEIAALAADPEALRQFLAERQAAVSGGAMSELPKISGKLLAVAQLAYAADPLNVAALRTIALGHILHEDPERARRIMRLAGHLNKRDDVTNLWLAQDYGSLGDVENMLASFDHALRTSRRAREAAMGPVVGLTGSTESHAVLGGLLKQRPEWEEDFWIEFSRNPVALANVGTFFENSGVSVEQMPERRRQVLYANLKRAGQFDDLYQLAALDPVAAAEAKAISEGRFVVADEAGPLGWALHSRGDFAARVHGTTGELQIDARAGSFGVAADRIARGGRRYRMALHMAEAVPANAAVRLTAVCVGERRRELARIALTSGAESGLAAVPAQDCDFISLEVSFEAAQGRSDPLIRIASIELSPA